MSDVGAMRWSQHGVRRCHRHQVSIQFQCSLYRIAQRAMEDPTSAQTFNLLCSFGANEMSRITNSNVVSSATSLFSAPFSPLETGEAAQCRLQGGPRSEGNRWLGRSVDRRRCGRVVVSCYRFSAESCVIFQRLFLGSDRDRLDDDKRLRVLGYDRGVKARAQSFHTTPLPARNRGRKR